MDLLKRSVFAGEFEPLSFEVGETWEDPRNWLHMEIETPRCMLPAVQAALSVRPKQLYGVNRSTITSVFLTTDALPGGWVEWEPLLDFSTPPYTAENGFSALAAIPFRDFPESGAQEARSAPDADRETSPEVEGAGLDPTGFLGEGCRQEASPGRGCRPTIEQRRDIDERGTPCWPAAEAGLAARC